MAGTIDFNTLWIGDPLKIISTGATGTFEGLDQKGVRVKVMRDVIYADPSDLTLHLPSESIDHHDEWSSGETTLPEDPMPTTIDLHLEKWPDFRASQWHTPMDFQVKQCKAFMAKAISQRVPSVVIIHGKGVGTLKQQVHHLLASYAEVFQVHEINQGGALEVMFNYRKM